MCLFWQKISDTLFMILNYVTKIYFGNSTQENFENELEIESERDTGYVKTI